MSHDHRQEGEGSTRALIIALFLNLSIAFAQVVGGLISGSLSLLADAAHNGSDAASLGISYIARRISRRKADRLRTFGYHRAEVIGAMINLTTLFAIAVYLFSQAISRFFNPVEIGGTTMLVVGSIAFVEDLISAWLLYRGSKESLNVRSAFIHMVGDTLATVGVIIGALLIMFYNLYIADPIITILVAVYISVHSYKEIRNAIHILMDSAPEDFDFDGMVRATEAMDGVRGLHHVHLWRLDEKRTALEAHVAVAEQELGKVEAIKNQIKQMLARDYDIEHTTLEIEISGRTEHDRSTVPRE